ncbi:hypothetical protein AYO37_00355 [Opitutia bacterium SCGC AG-212-L18]|nr:hypothetical protein AYO37_00355 [Opitutae bacterium SCGC AG-212-L18]
MYSLSQRLFIGLVFYLVYLFIFANSCFAKTNLNGESYYSLREVASKLRLKLHWNAQRTEVTLIGQNIRMSFLDKKRYVIIDGIQIWLGRPMFLKKNELYISENDFLKAIVPIVLPCNDLMPSKLFNIVIDAGHGGHDEGTSNSEYEVKEKDLTLDLSMRLMEELEKLGYKVMLTRKEDQYITLKDRCDFANRVNADLLISIHFNSVENGKKEVCGIETYILSLEDHPSTSSHSISESDKVALAGNKNDYWNALVAYNIQKNLINDLKAVDRGVKRARFAVLKTLNCPGVLVEAGFLSHPEECQKISSSTYRQKIAQSIAAGVLSYQRKLN